MNADKRGWIRVMGLTATFFLTAIASQARSEEALFVLTPLIERLGESEPTSDGNVATDRQPNHDDPLEQDGLQARHVREVQSDNGRVTVPSQGPAPIRLEFEFQPVWNEGINQQFDFRILPAPPAPRRDDSYLLATGTFQSNTLGFNR